jgi:hypothetical protein
MGLHSWSLTEGRELWDIWSKKSSKFNLADQDRTWGAFEADGGCTISTIFHYARNGDFNFKIPLEENQLAAQLAEHLEGKF